jgi:hypothetical protein
MMNDEKILTMARDLVRKCTAMQMKIDIARRRLKVMREARAAANREQRRRQSLQEKF